MHPQTIYDVVLFSLRKQGHASYRTREDGGVQCAYRGDNGDRCAVGMWIADGVYDPEMEGKGVFALTHGFGNLPDWVHTNADLLQRLQSAHDCCSGMPHWQLSFERSMQRIAEDYGLHYTPVGEEPEELPTVERALAEASA